MGHDENELEQREEEDVEKLEEDVNEMAQKILHYRTTLPDQLKSALASSLVAQRPAFPTHLSHGSEPGPSGCTNPGDVLLLGFSILGFLSLSLMLYFLEHLQPLLTLLFK